MRREKGMSGGFPRDFYRNKHATQTLLCVSQESECRCLDCVSAAGDPRDTETELRVWFPLLRESRVSLETIVSILWCRRTCVGSRSLETRERDVNNESRVTE